MIQNGLSISENVNTIADFKIDKELISPEESSLVFKQDLVLTKTTEKNLELILYPIFERRNILLVGDAGIGKNALVYFINRQRNLPTIRFSFNQDTLPEDLVGSFRILPDGFHWQDGPLIHAMKKGYTFVADEMNLASPEILKRFISVLEHNRLYLLEKDGSELKAHPRFRFIATQNPSRGFEGRKVLPESISRLFTFINLSNYPLQEESEIISGLFPSIDKNLIKQTCSLQRALEAAIWEGEIAKDDFEHYHFNIRSAQRFWQRLIILKNIKDESPEFLVNVFEFYVDTFRLENDRKKALEITAKQFNFALSQLTKEYQLYREENPQIKISDLSFHTKGEALDPMPLTQNRLRAMTRIKRSLENNENLLLEGEDPVRLGELIVELAELEGQKVKWIFLAKGMHTSEIIGALRPSDSTNATNSKVEWIDGPLVQALKNNEWIILDNIEAAGSELIEKLNMLLDHAGTLAMPPEAAGDSFVKKEGKARIIGIKRSRKSRNQSTISRAFRNRFTNIHISLVSDIEELSESALIYWDSLFTLKDEDHEFVNKLTLFHSKLQEACVEKKIGQNIAGGINFREENLLRWIGHVNHWLDKNDSDLKQVLESGIRVHYLAALPTEADREYANKLWQRIANDMPLDNWDAQLKSRKKKLKNKNHNKKMYWDPEKHRRAANTGKAKPKLSGKPLKKGLRIDTPETGGNTKEGADAWYGEDTQGNGGVGEPVGGGGAWGYKTDELFQAFLKKYKPKWDYNMGYHLQDYYEIFGKMLRELEMDLENALESNMHIHRQLASYGTRIEARRYISYLAQKGNDRIFDHSRIIHTEDKLKGLEFAFFINKGRRLFNFHYSVASVVALQSAMEVLWDKKIPLKTFGYSDFDNRKKSLDLVEYTNSGYAQPPTHEEKEFIFDQMADDWEGDTVEEFTMLQNIDTCFSSDASTKIAVIVSDFRGHRGRAKIEDELNSDDNIQLSELVKEYSRQNYVFLGMQTGTRYIAEHIFDHHVWINEDNFDTAPLVLADEIKKLILRYHRPVV